MWFTETPWPPIMICTALAVLMFARWYANHRGIHLLGVVSMFVLSGAIYVVEQTIVTDIERVEAAVHGLTTAFEQGELQKTLNFISPKAVEIRTLVGRAMQFVEVEDDLRVTDLQVTMKSQNSRAISHFRANATLDVVGHGHVGWHTSRWELTWRREADEWKVIKLRRLNPITGEEIRNPLAKIES